MALKLCIFLGVLSVILFMMSLLSFILFFEVCNWKLHEFFHAVFLTITIYVIIV
nr:MAG TPA: hypothetical protein [Inoviridae sp.]